MSFPLGRGLPLKGKESVGQISCRCGCWWVSRGSVTFLGSTSRNSLFPSPACPTLQGSWSLGPSNSWWSMTWNQGSLTSCYRLRPVSELGLCMCLLLRCLPFMGDIDPTTEAKFPPHLKLPNRTSGAQKYEVKPGVWGRMECSLDNFHLIHHPSPSTLAKATGEVACVRFTMSLALCYQRQRKRFGSPI